MAITVKPVTLWRRDVENVPGVLADTLGPLADAHAGLGVVMGYRMPDHPQHSVVEVWPISGRRATDAARKAGLAPADVPCLLIEGDDRPGLGAEIGRACADAGINIAFCMAIAMGRRFTAAVGFADQAAAQQALRVLRQRLCRPVRAPRAGSLRAVRRSAGAAQRARR